MTLLLMLLSFSVSTLISRWVYQTKPNKRLGISFAFLSNLVILSAAASVWYYTSENMRISGVGAEQIAYLTIGIPLVTWVNALLLAFTEPRKKKRASL